MDHDCHHDDPTHGPDHAGHGGHGHDAMTRDLMMAPRMANHPHQHAMTLVGHKTVFAVHMTQFYMEEHKYQLIFEVILPPAIAAELDRHRRHHPGDWFVLSNDESDLFTIPELASGRRRSYRAQIFQGLPPFSHRAEEDPHFYPWSRDRVRPLLTDFTVEVGRIVMFRPFAHHLIQPEFATYLMWGKGDEAHLTNLQTARLHSGPFQTLSFGPDYDHVLSLRERPDGLDDAALEAGMVFSAPSIRLRHHHDHRQCLPRTNPIVPDRPLTLLYRGILPALTVLPGPSFLFGSAVLSSPDALRPDQVSLEVSRTPKSMILKDDA